MQEPSIPTNAEEQEPSTPIAPFHGRRPYDVMVYGATGFTGELVAYYLLEHYGATHLSDDGVSWCIAGRSQTKLKLLKLRLEEKAKRLYPDKEFILDVIVAESDDKESLENMTKKARVVLTTVGPFLKHGLPLVEACIRTQTDYVDITGEMPFVHESTKRFHAHALAEGCRIVHGCGFDAMPSDLGVHYLKEATEARGLEVEEVWMMLHRAFGGGMSRGTVRSILNLYEWASEDPKRFKFLQDPCALNEDKEGVVRVPDLETPFYDEVAGHWCAPFILAPYNVRLVRRTNELLSYRYGRDFRYQEAVRVRSAFGRVLKDRLSVKAAVVKAWGMSLMRRGMSTLLTIPRTRKVVRNLYSIVATNPDVGSKDSQGLKAVFSGRHKGKEVVQVTLTSEKEPGYAGTAIMVTEAALALVKNREELGLCGVVTPAAGIGAVLRRRLEATGSFEFDLKWV